MKPAFVRIYPALVIKETPLEALYRSGSIPPYPLMKPYNGARTPFRSSRTAGIEVIRMGLQPTEELESPGTILAGPYHPAFRQLVDSSILLRSARGHVLCESRRLFRNRPDAGTSEP